jgi:NADH-quinone oxidoreductase subunit L
MKWTAVTMLIGSLSLAGFPLFTGFFSKDEIIVVSYEYGMVISYLPYIMLIIAATLTAIYTFRMWFNTFTGEPRSDYHKHESPWIMLGPLVILAVFAFGFGLWSQGGFYSYLDTTFEHYDVNFDQLATIGGHPTEEIQTAGQEEAAVIGEKEEPEKNTEEWIAAEKGAIEVEKEPAEPWYIQILPIIIAIGGILVAAMFYYWRRWDTRKITSERDPIRVTLQKGYYQHEILTQWFAEGVVYGTAIISNIIDIKLVDGWLNWLSAWVLGLGGHVRKVQTGVLQNYIAAIVLGIVVLVIAIVLVMEVGLA